MAQGQLGDSDKLTPGNVAYIAYGQQVNFVAFNGDPMPMWNEALPLIRDAWEVAARAAIDWDKNGMVTLTRPE